MSTNILNLKLYPKYVRAVKSLTIKDSGLQKLGISYIDDYLNYLHKCHNSITDKINSGVSNNPKKNNYKIVIGEFSFSLIINKDLSCIIGVELVQKSQYKINDSLLKSIYCNSSGFVYFLKSEYGYKIGCTRDINRRFTEIKTQMPFKLELDFYIKTSDFLSLEKELHNEFDSKRLNGEWFSLVDSDIEKVKKQYNV